jgi:pantothenate kinase type III
MTEPTLLIDIGNSAVKWRLHRGSRHVSGRLPYAKDLAQALRDQWARQLEGLNRQPQRGAAAVDYRDLGWHVVYCRVASQERVDTVMSVVGQLFPGTRQVLMPQARLCLGLGKDVLMVRCGYRRPTALGADRWAAVLGLAAHARRLRPLFLAASDGPARAEASSPLAVWVVSAGTATVIDLVWAEARPDGSISRLDHAGGLILPGIGLMRESLTQATGGLAPFVAAAAKVHRFSGVPRQPHHAVARGIEAAQVGGLLVLPPPTAIVLYGGHARAWLSCFRSVGSDSDRPPLTQPLVIPAPGLVLDGLQQWARRRAAAQPRGPLNELPLS